jgi:hypothetical protein
MNPACRVVIRCAAQARTLSRPDSRSRRPWLDRQLQAQTSSAIDRLEAYGAIRTIGFEKCEVRNAPPEKRDAQEREDGTQGQEPQAGYCHRTERSTKKGRKGSEAHILALEKALAT